MTALMARSVRGLEWVAADEISSVLPEARGIGMASREVSFLVADLTPGVLGLRTVDDVFLTVGRVTGAGPARNVLPLVAQRIAGLDWAGALALVGGIRELAGRPELDVVASLEGRHGYNRFAMEQAVGQVLAPVLSGSYLARTSQGGPAGQPDLTVRLFVRGTEAVAALRIAARPLHRREYKQDSGAGTLHPPVAAALARLAVPAGPADRADTAGRAGTASQAGTASRAEISTVADPFCGDGTIAIETALSGPGIRVLASDIDPSRLASAERNAARAGVRLTLERLDAGRLPWPGHGIDAVITNPPWNRAVGASGLLGSSLDPFWRQLPALLAAGGRLCLIADTQLDAPARLRQLGYQLALATQVRLAGRVSQVLLCGPAGQRPPPIPDGLAGWRSTALADGVITESGF